MSRDSDTALCPFCGEGVLMNRICPTCAKTFLLCDECESVYMEKEDAMERAASKCPYCGAQAD